MERIHYTNKLSKGDRVLARFDKRKAFGEYWVKDIRGEFVGLATHEYSFAYSFYKLDEIELYKEQDEANR